MDIYNVGFDARLQFSLADGNAIVIITVVGNTSSVHIANKKKNILVLGEGPAQDDATITAGINYLLCLSNILKDFTIDNMKKAGLKRVVKFIILLLIPTISYAS